MTPLVPLVAALPGGPELLIILAVAVLLFGASKLPDLARSMGTAQGEFAKGRTQAEQELQKLGDETTTEYE